MWTVPAETWYLAIDQFGYLTFADDLAHGHALHDWRLLPALKPLLPQDLDVDVFAQTYVRHGDALFCRYSPGFPLVLALARLLFGPTAEHLRSEERRVRKQCRKGCRCRWSPSH